MFLSPFFRNQFVYLSFSHSLFRSHSLLFLLGNSLHILNVCARVLHTFVKYLAKDNITNGNYNGLNTQMCLHIAYNHVVCVDWNRGSPSDSVKIHL